VPTIKADATLGKEYHEYPGACTLTVGLNNTTPPFDNLKVRQAFATGFDREGYIRDALKGTDIPTLTWIPPGYPGYDKSETRFGYDPAKAKQLLADAGFPDGKGLPEIKYSYASNNPANQARAEYIVQMYQKSLGVTVTPDPVENTTLVSLRKDVKTFPQMTGAGWCADYPDQQDWLSIYYACETSFAKDIGYCNKEADKLMAQADVEIDPAKRADLYDQAQKLIIGDVPEIIRDNTKNYFLIKPNVAGVDFTPQDSDLPGLMTGLLNATLQK
jgi:oligopeptide transport system substrate-binding protein